MVRVQGMTAKAGCTFDRKKEIFLFLLSFLDQREGRENLLFPLSHSTLAGKIPTHIGSNQA